MNPIRSTFFILAIAAWSPASAETMKFEDAAALLGASCAKDIDANCRGVNLDPVRMKDCLYRNQDVLSPQCKTDYVLALDAIQKRVAARSAVTKLCERDVAKFCPGVPKGDRGKAIGCLLAGPRGVSINCNKAVSEAAFIASPSSAPTPAGGTPEDWVTRLAGLDTPPDLDVAALRQQAMDRIKAKADAAPLNRAPVAPDLLKLPQFAAEIKFDEDAAVVRPESYRTLGRIADTLHHPSLLGYKFLIVGHTVPTGRRENNLTLSQRRADVIREVLINTFKISPKRLVTIGLGEEQMLDAVHPAAPINQSVQLATVGTLEANPAAVAPAAVPTKAGTKKRKR